MQIEVSLNINQKALIAFCKNLDITVTGYSPLGQPGNRYDLKNLWDAPIIQDLVAKYKKTPAQIALRFIVGFFYFKKCSLLSLELNFTSKLISVSTWSYTDSKVNYRI